MWSRLPSTALRQKESKLPSTQSTHRTSELQSTSLPLGWTMTTSSHRIYLVYVVTVNLKATQGEEDVVTEVKQWTKLNYRLLTGATFLLPNHHSYLQQVLTEHLYAPGTKLGDSLMCCLLSTPQECPAAHLCASLCFFLLLAFLPGAISRPSAQSQCPAFQAFQQHTSDCRNNMHPNVGPCK
jgi:hypothetical protein